MMWNSKILFHIIDMLILFICRIIRYNIETSYLVFMVELCQIP